MADWKENKAAGIAAAIVIVISIIILTTALMRRQKGASLSPEIKAAIQKDINAMQQMGK